MNKALKRSIQVMVGTFLLFSAITATNGYSLTFNLLLWVPFAGSCCLLVEIFDILFRIKR